MKSSIVTLDGHDIVLNEKEASFVRIDDKWYEITYLGKQVVGEFE